MNITHLIELNQLGSVGVSNSNLLYIHKDPISYGTNATIQKLIDDISNTLSSK